VEPEKHGAVGVLHQCANVATLWHVWRWRDAMQYQSSAIAVTAAI
jgi:hypothetical protein